MANRIAATGTVNALGYESEAPSNFAFATWRAIPYANDGTPIFKDGSKVPSYNGQLNAAGDFAGALIGDTSQMLPTGATYMFQVFPVASVPPITISNVRINAGSPLTLGAIISAQTPPLRIQAGPMVYAYSDKQIVNPTAGSGYTNTTTNTSWVFVGSGSVGDWLQVSGGGGGGGEPMGPNGAVQYNNSGAFAGSGAAITDGAGNLNLTGNIQTATLATSASSYVAGKTNITTTPSSCDIEPPSPFGTIYLGINQAGLINFAGNGSIDRSGNTHFIGAMENNGAVTFDSTLHVIGTSTFAGVHAAGAVTFDSTLTVAMDAAVVGNVAVGGQLAVTGTFSANHADLQSLEVHAAAQLDATLSVVGSITSPALAILGGLKVPAIIFPTSAGTLNIGTETAITAIQVDTGGGTKVLQGLSVLGRGAQPARSLTLFYDNGTGTAFLDSVGPATGTRGAMHLRVYDADGNFTLDGLIIGNDGGVSVPISSKVYTAPTINNVTGSRAFSTPYQNTSGMSLQVCMSYTTAGSSTGFVTANVGPSNPPANQVYRNENTASVAAAELAVVLTVPRMVV